MTTSRKQSFMRRWAMPSPRRIAARLHNGVTQRARGWRRTIATAALLLAAGAGLAACGVPIDTSAHSIKQSPVYVPQAVPEGPGGTASKLTLYFVKGSSLVAVHRSGYVYSSVETTANELLLDLDNGPLTSEGHGLITLLNSQPGLTCTFDPQTRIITVNLDSVFLNTLFGPPLYDAYGQIVLTLMGNRALSSVQGIQFDSGGQLTYAYLPTETATQQPVTPDAYRSLIANGSKKVTR